MVKYTAISAFACVLGYLLSLFAGNLFTANISLYMGKGKQTIWNWLLPVTGAGIVFVAIIIFCMVILRRFRQIFQGQGIAEGRIGTGCNVRPLLQFLFVLRKPD